jgi:UDP-N-acetylmuramoyl-L-alanyl-D-glutamate--2,6-diaminopimelate ligase
VNVEAALPLGALIALLEARGLLRAVIPGGGETADHVAVADVVLDSRLVRPGSLFAAVVGERRDGHGFVREAVAAGAGAVLAERPTDGLPAPQLIVAAARPAVAVAAAWRFGFPSHRLGVIGVTGTDGKTTTTFLVRAILAAAGLPSGLLSTVDVVVGGRSLGNAERLTTPDAPRLQALLADMVRGGDRFAVVEASSHGLAQDRVGEVAWDVAVLTNVTEEHLEFHRTREAYLAAKARLFAALAAGPANPEKGFGKSAALNADDPAAAAFGAIAAAAGARLITYGAATEADVRLVGLGEDGRRLLLSVVAPRWDGTLSLRLAGRFNAHNALAAVAVGEALDLDPAAVRSGLEGLTGVPGRMERVEAGQPFGVIVDYAHTADALAKVLDELSPVAAGTGGGLIAVFGSAGERDLVKRPAMGRVAGDRCRLVVLTDEDPRGEDRATILSAIARGAEAAGRRRGVDLLLVADRREAIGTAIEKARPGDVVLFAGKGHEKTIETAAGPVAWDEADEVRAALAAAGWAEGLP